MPVPAAVPVPAAGGAGAHPNEQDLVDSLVSYNLFKIPVLVQNVVVTQFTKIIFIWHNRNNYKLTMLMLFPGPILGI
jgi:hypothetical protein